MIYARWAEDDTEAVLKTNAIEGAGGEVICLTPNGEATHTGASLPHVKLIVWFRVKDHAQGDRIDEAIGAALDDFYDAVKAKRKLMNKKEVI